MENTKISVKEVFDPIRQDIRQKTGKKKKVYATLSDYVCSRCGEKVSEFSNKEIGECPVCKSTSFHEVQRFSSDTVSEVMNRQLLYIALDGMEFTDKLACEAYNSYLIGNTVEADKCPQCGALHLVQNVDRTRCENCGLSSQYFKRGFLKRPSTPSILTSS